jgi:hypothetical protein
MKQNNPAAEREMIYGSLRPMLDFVIGAYSPQSVVEDGAGLYSTKMLLGFPCFKSVLSIESDSEWYFRLRKEFSLPTETARIMYLPAIEGMRVETPYRSVVKPCLSEHQRALLEASYQWLHLVKRNENDLSLLVIDGFTATRKMLLDNFARDFDIVIVHDTEEESREQYCFDKDFAADIKSYSRFDVRIVAGSSPVGCSAFFSPPIVVDQDSVVESLREKYAEYATYYWSLGVRGKIDARVDFFDGTKNETWPDENERNGGAGVP